MEEGSVRSTEENLHIQKVYKLRNKSLYSGNVDRQEVCRVDNIFYDSTILRCPMLISEKQ